ncbi:MAG: hypothetical protein KBD83_07165 [Gammaproteobacteria bacterium]|nr:hypothetical protein [Gammaproteobacteria bacterium]
MMMQPKKTVAGFALLNILLGISLLVGIVYLIMHAMSHFHQDNQSRVIGEELAPIVSELLQLEDLSGSGEFPLIYNAEICPNSGGLVTDIPKGYLLGLKSNGFDLCDKTKAKVSFSS